MNRADVDAVLEKTPRARFDHRKNYGIGINDSTFQVSTLINGHKVSHRAYAAWTGILQRCYSEKFQKDHPTYSGCEVYEGWLYFSNFLPWWRENFNEGCEIDKDILVPGNKIYSPDTCIYVPRFINCFVTDCERRGNKYPIGVTYWEPRKKFRARTWVNGKLVTIGLYKTVEEAHEAWFKKKIEIAFSFKSACDEVNIELFDRLINKIHSMKHEV